MPSPFPGMNPYLEQEDVWPDFHRTAIPIIRRHLAPKLAPEFIVTIGTHIYMHELSAEQRRMLGEPDVSVLAGRGPAGGIAIADPAVSPAVKGLIPVQVERVVVPYLEVQDARTRGLVTAIELLSPSNKKPGRSDRDAYLAKRAGYLSSDANLVEIDLLRGHTRLPAVGLPPCDYVVVVSRAAARPAAEFFPVQLRERLPVVPIPLTAAKPEVSLDLQAVVHESYDEAVYGAYIYEHDPVIPLKPEDAKWAREIAAAAGQ